MDQPDQVNESQLNMPDNNIFVSYVAQILNSSDRNKVLLETSGLRNPDLTLWISELIKVADALVIRQLCGNYSAGEIRDQLDTLRVGRQVLCLLLEVADLKPIPAAEIQEPEGSIDTP